MRRGGLQAPRCLRAAGQADRRLERARLGARQQGSEAGSALPAGADAGLGPGRGVRRLHAFCGRGARRVLPLAAEPAGRPARAPAPRARSLRAGRRDGLSRSLLHRGARASGRVRGRPPRDRPFRRRRPLARGRHGREQGELRGLDPDRPGRPADAHLPADPLDDALAEGAP